MSGSIKKTRSRRRYKCGEKALKEIAYYQKTDKLIIPLRRVRRGIRYEMENMKAGGFRMTQVAFNKIHAALEDHIVTMFRSAQIMAIHAKRVTIMPDDLYSLFRVYNSMQGKTDLSEEPINPKMSAAHRKTKKKRKRSKTQPVVIVAEAEQSEQPRKKRKRKKTNTTVSPVVMPIIQEELEEEREPSVDIQNEEKIYEVEQEQGDWCLEEEY